MKILIIEDEEPLRAEILEVLDLEQFQAIGAEDGQLGVEAAQQHRPDLIICDVMMPALNGHDVLKLLREDADTATIPFIFLTARAERSDLRRGMALGADDYLVKPFTRQELLEAIAARLQKQIAVDRQSQKQLDELRHNITRLLPHELHTPLSGVIGMAELLIAEYGSIDPNEAIEMLDTIRASGERLYNLTRNFLLYADLELLASNPQRVAELRAQTAQTNLCCVLSHVARHQAQVFDRSKDLQLELEDAVAPIAEAKLQKAAEEIIDNAFKFSQPGSPVRVVCRSHPHPSFTVIDSGRGMTPTQISQIGAYMQFDRKLYEQQGSGMGLIITKRLIELFGGRLAIESVPGKKTMVSATFGQG